jgi:uncharacterized membrane protein
MRSVGVLSYVFIFVLLAAFANATTIYGSVYDLSLEKIDNALVEINTTPRQVIVANNGSYSFSVVNGAYSIKAKLMQKNDVIAFVQENITINQDGRYILDLILFPDLEEGVEDIDFEVNGNVINNNKGIFIGFFVLLIIVIGLFLYFRRVKKPKEEKKEDAYEDGDLENIIKIIRQEGGRATQKDIRKQIPLSEAKISLMIAELEHKGIVEKIKKGRGNIVILKK